MAVRNSHVRLGAISNHSLSSMLWMSLPPGDFQCESRPAAEEPSLNVRLHLLAFSQLTCRASAMMTCMRIARHALHYLAKLICR